MPVHLLSRCSRIVYHENNVRWCTGQIQSVLDLGAATDVVLKGFSFRFTYTRMCYVSDN